MKLTKEELKEIVDCIDFANNQLRFLDNFYKSIEDKYRFGRLNYLITLRNKITTWLNKEEK